MRSTRIGEIVQNNAESVVSKLTEKKFRKAGKSRPAKGFIRAKNLNEATAVIFKPMEGKVHDKFATRRQRVRDAYDAGDLIAVMSDDKKVTKYTGEVWPVLEADQKKVLVGYRTLTIRERRRRETSLRNKRERGSNRAFARKNHGASIHANTRRPVAQRA